MQKELILLKAELPDGIDAPLTLVQRKNFFHALQTYAGHAVAAPRPDHVSLLELRGDVFVMPTYNVIVEAIWQAFDVTSIGDDWAIKQGSSIVTIILYRGHPFRTLYDLAVFFTGVANLNPVVVNAMGIDEYFKLIQTSLYFSERNGTGFEEHWLLPPTPLVPQDDPRWTIEHFEYTPLKIGVLFESMRMRMAVEVAKVTSLHHLSEEVKRLHERLIIVSEDAQAAIDENATLNTDIQDLYTKLGQQRPHMPLKPLDADAAVNIMPPQLFTEEFMRAEGEEKLWQDFINMNSEEWRAALSKQTVKSTPSLANYWTISLACLNSFIVGVLTHEYVKALFDVIIDIF